MDLVALGLVVGMANALLASGLVLIYMANRVINFAHGELGAFAVAMMIALTRNAHLNYWLALLCSLAATAALGALIEKTFLSRLFKSPRLIVLIATIGVAQLVTVGRLILPKPSLGHGDVALAGGANIFPVPFHWAPIEFGRVVLLPQHVMALIAGPLLALGLFAFLRWSAYGVALRASAENAPRARLLGIPVRHVSTMAWVIGALLAGCASILLAPITGFSATEAVGLPILMRGLAAATVARMESVGTAFGVGLALGVLDQLIFYYTGRSGLTDMVLFVVILGTLLYRGETSRRTVASEESSWEVADPVRPLPPDVVAHPRWRTVTGVATTACIVIALLVPRFVTVSGTHFLATVLLVAVVAVSLTVLMGWAGQMSIGQWALAGVGGVLGAKVVTQWGVPFWGGFVIAALLGGLFALILGFPALRLGGTALAVVTLGFAVASASWLFNQEWFKGTGFLPRPSYLTTTAYYYVTIVVLALAVMGTRTLQRTRVGRNMVAVRDNPRQAAAMGIDIVRTKLTAFVLAGVFAGGAGFLWASGVSLASTTVFPPSRSLGLVAAVVIGGLGSVSGAVLGTLYLMVVPYLGSQVSPYLGLLSSGIGLLVLVLFFPGGLARLVAGGRDVIARVVTGLDARPRVVPQSAAPSPTATPASEPVP
jgi:branched-chain amino acid transport system permease protein